MLHRHDAKSDAPLAVVVVQMLVTVGCAIATCNLQFGEGTKLWAMSVPPLFAAMMATSTLALRYVTIGTFVVVRNGSHRHAGSGRTLLGTPPAHLGAPRPHAAEP